MAQARTPARPRATTFHAVEVVSRAEACEAAHALRGKRFLSREAPSLPLRECDGRECRCVYAHHDDRRQGPRRETQAKVSDGPSGRERRIGRGRRQTD